VRRCDVQNADGLSKFVDTMDFSLRPELLARVRSVLGVWDIDRFAAGHNTTAHRFNALFGCAGSEGADAPRQEWGVGVSFALPNFHVIDEVLDVIERDNATAILIVPAWLSRPWWTRIWSTAWVRAGPRASSSLPTAS